MIFIGTETRDKEIILNISGFHNHSSSILNEQLWEKGKTRHFMLILLVEEQWYMADTWRTINMCVKRHMYANKYVDTNEQTTMFVFVHIN